MVSPKKKKPKKQKEKDNKVYEEYAFILDVSEDRRVAYVMGETHFRLLEVELKTPNNANLMIGRQVYLGKSNERDLIKYVRRRLASGDKLPKQARLMARIKTQQIVQKAVNKRECKLYDASCCSSTMHHPVLYAGLA